MDNYGDPVDLMVGRVWFRRRQRHSLDSSLAGRSCDRLDLQPGLWPTRNLEPRPKSTE